MKNLKKMTRKHLGMINGAASNCNSCPRGGFGPGGSAAGYTYSCEDYYELVTASCSTCVLVSSACFQ